MTFGAKALAKMLGTVCLVLAGLCFVSASSQAQTCPTPTGFNTVYGTCNGSTASEQGAFATIDATQFSSYGDICAAISQIFYTYRSVTYGVVVDARGFNPGATQGCGTNPWSATALPVSTVVLLPAGTITIAKTWVLPKAARIIGLGANLTTIQACTTASSGCSSNLTGDMIDMGNATVCSMNDCTAVSIEHIGLNGNGVASNGIVNGYSQELSYVNDVAFSALTGVGLTVTSNYASNSGPYSNLTMSNVATCVEIYGTTSAMPTTSFTDTRGIHGLTCTGSTSAAAIYIDAPNNSLEDIYVTGSSTQDGILIGYNAIAENNILFNINGSGLNTIIHISNQTNTPVPGTSVPNCPLYNSSPGTKPFNVCDITILGVTNSGGSGTTIQDDLTSNTLTDAHIGMYVLGEPVQIGPASGFTGIGNSFLTTSPHAPAWLVGTVAPSSTSCQVGSLFSRTSGSGTTTLYGCSGASSGSWIGID